jgi:hypothetical protein
MISRIEAVIDQFNYTLLAINAEEGDEEDSLYGS